MPKRSACSVCHYPSSHCICKHVTQISSTVAISILQDPTETKHAKNSARLIPLVMPQAEIFVGLFPNDFVPAREKLKQFTNTLLLYPNESSLTMDEYHHRCGEFGKPDHIILLDGTWRKAKKMWLNNPWLHELTTATLPADRASEYRIRKAPFAHSYSSIEALATTLNILNIAPSAPLLKVFSAMQAKWPVLGTKAL
ncbi:tRNA-uridine aminocarboxypropyltransferase [Glaciecola siphonariae]|uniref:tRNA-uridine aminocarboxypropyltransferase n=1 Tax=Glaciecola siphonariae TaxID=521012 RepID=A0ABV9LY93_9ALTE